MPSERKVQSKKIAPVRWKVGREFRENGSPRWGPDKDTLSGVWGKYRGLSPSAFRTIKASEGGKVDATSAYYSLLSASECLRSEFAFSFSSVTETVVSGVFCAWFASVSRYMCTCLTLDNIDGLVAEWRTMAGWKWRQPSPRGLFAKTLVHPIFLSR